MRFVSGSPLGRLTAALVILCLLCPDAGAQSKKKKKRSAKPPPTATAPAEPPAPAAPLPAPQTARELLQQLSRPGAPEAKRSDAALRAGLDFALATCAADGARAAAWVEAVGYQPLPIEGALPELPQKPILPAKVKELVAARASGPADGLPPGIVELKPRSAFHESFAAGAQWMLPDDFAVICKPVEGNAEWVTRECFLIVRVRAGRATVMGGSFLENLPRPAVNPRL